MKQLSVIGVDLAKNIFQIHALDKLGHCCLKKSLRRSQFLSFFAKLQPCLIGMEACGGSHYWARELISLGHDVRLMPPQYVKPYVKTNKNDAADAEAIAEAVTRPNMRFVDVKSVEQQTILLIHRERDGLVKERTSLINRLRATLAEFGIAIPTGRSRLKNWFKEQYGNYEDSLPEVLKSHICQIMIRWQQKEEQIVELEKVLDKQRCSSEPCQRLTEVTGLGALTSSALVATVGNAKSYKSGRQLSAWLGIVPRQNSSGGKQVLQGISKRGNSYLRRLFIHGARALLRHIKPSHPWYEWVQGLECRMHRNKVIVAIANKLVRVAWAILHKGTRYQP